MDELKSNNIRFEISKIHENLAIVKNTSNQLVGYVSKIPYEGWLWFIGLEISDNQYQTLEEAAQNLLQTYLIFKMDKMSQKLGIADDPNFVKK